MSAKEILLEVAEKLPSDATLNDAIYELQFRQAVQQGLDEASFPEMGRVVPEFRQPNLREIICGSYRIILMSQTWRNAQHEENPGRPLPVVVEY